MRTITLASLAVVLAGTLGCARGHTFSDPAKPVEVRRGTEFDVALESNQSTGYQWVLVDSAALGPLRRVGKDYSIPRRSRGANGAGGTETWTFAATAPGEVTLSFVY